MKVASAVQMKAHWGEYLEHCELEPAVVTKRGQLKAVLLPVHDEEDLERLLISQDPTFRSIISMSERSLAEHGGITHEEFWRRVDSEFGKQD